MPKHNTASDGGEHSNNTFKFFKSLHKRCGGATTTDGGKRDYVDILELMFFNSTYSIFLIQFTSADHTKLTYILSAKFTVLFVGCVFAISSDETNGEVCS